MRKLHPLIAAAAAILSAAPQACTGLGGLQHLPDAQAAIAEMRLPPASLKLDAAADRGDRTYRPGERIRLSVRLDKPAYLAILAVDKNGETRLLFPNKAHPGAALPANAAVPIPGPRDGFAIVAPGPGTLLVEVLASTDGSTWLFHRPPADGAQFADLGATTHLLAREIARALTHNGAAAAAVALVIRVKGD